jgi:hypothetical protein
MQYITDTDLYTILTRLNENIDKEAFYNNLQFQVIHKIYFKSIKDSKKISESLFISLENDTNLNPIEIMWIKERFLKEIAKDKHRDLKNTKFFKANKEKLNDRAKKSALDINLQLSFYFSKEELEFLNKHLTEDFFLKDGKEFIDDAIEEGYIDKQYMEDWKDTSIFTICHNLAKKTSHKPSPFRAESSGGQF